MNKRFPGMAAPLHQRAPRRMLPTDPRSERDNGAGGALIPAWNEILAPGGELENWEGVAAAGICSKVEM